MVAASSKEVTVDEARLERMTAVNATDNAVAPASLSGADLRHVHERVREVARLLLTGDELAAVEHFLSGKTQQEVARAMGCSETKISRILHGASAASRSTRASAIDKLVGFLRVDVAFLKAYGEAVTLANDEATAPPPRAYITDWYLATVTPQRPDLVGPLAVLMVMAQLADRQKRQVSVGDLYKYLPPIAVNASLPILQGRGYTRSDGVTVTIVKTPGETVSGPPPSSFAVSVIEAALEPST